MSLLKNMDCLEIVYQDADIIVVNKPGGLLSVPGRGPEKQDCVVNRVKLNFPQCIAQPAVHRLDMATSGLLVLAFTRTAQSNLAGQFARGEVYKQYVAVLDGVIHQESGTIELPFRLDPENRPYQVYDPVNGKWGISKWRRIGIDKNTTRVDFFPLTGRTHQLRLHAAHPHGLNSPILGDSLYGSGEEGDRMFLHAEQLCFRHPNSGEKIRCLVKASF